MLHYMKFFHYYLVALLSCAGLLLADYFIVIGFISFVLFYALGDALLGNDISTPNLSNKTFINLMLYGSLPLSILLITCCLWLVTPNQWPIMQWLSNFTGYDFILAKANTSYIDLFFAISLSGFILTTIATVVAHELVHRVGKTFDVIYGRWLLCFSFDANFSIEHVFNHHVKVATEEDPVTAPRGRNVYTHILYATIGSNYSAWLIEKKRLGRKKKSMFSYHNKCLRGYAMSLIYLLFVLLLASWQGLLLMLLIGIMAKILLEVANYIEHYGLVRDPRQRVQPKHSWNANNRISTWSMFNLPRHSHHHAQASVPFEKLQPMPDAPMMISGYISTVFIALVPPIWFKLMKPKLEHWDKHFANEKELDILALQARSKEQYHGLTTLFY